VRNVAVPIGSIFIVGYPCTRIMGHCPQHTQGDFTMHEQELKVQQPAEQQEAVPTPQRIWEQPVLQQIDVSFDTAALPGSGPDGETTDNFD
jgi:hypothetical protein